MLIAGLLFEARDGRSRFLVKPGQRVIIGRHPPPEPQNVRPKSMIVSRSHARITGDAGGFIVEDAGSTSGTYVNDEQIRGPTPIGPGDRLRLTSDVDYEARVFFGESLWDILRRGPLFIDEGRRMAIDVLRALLPLHDAGQCHGDLTPHEILRAPDGAFTLIIQGWSALGDDGTVQCNPAYLAPEVFCELCIEPASDVYALGLIVFEALAGERPFSTDTPQQNMLAKVRGPEPAWPLQWPAELRGWIQSMITARPSDRLAARSALGADQDKGTTTTISDPTQSP